MRSRLFSIAYRMLGSVSEAEDIVQEAFLRLHRASADSSIDSPEAFLTTVTSRLAIDHLRSARARRERYVGEWLPEPLVTEPAPDVAQHVEMADSLSLAFLVLLESLSPVERAVFLLHDVFGYGYDEIAPIVDKTEANCRQIAVRARRRVDERKPRFEASREKRRRLAERFFAAIEHGETGHLVQMLASDVVVHGDGGGHPDVPNWGRPITGRSNVAALLGGLAAQLRAVDGRVRPTEINGQPGCMFVDRAGNLVNVFVLDIADDQIQTIRSIINPDKLRHLGPLADVRALMRLARGR
jgi:RNA polymerase sigma-70 factor (ECF subfamily)